MPRLVSFLFTASLSFVASLIFSHTLFADDALLQRQDVQKFIDQMTVDHQFKKTDLIETFKDVQLQPQIIESMNKPYEKKNWDVYKQLFLTPQRVLGGIEFWRANLETLQQAEKAYGVPANIIVAIIGVETLYGKNQGSYRVIDALSTLAFNYPSRSAFFTKELREYLLLCREHGVTPNQYLGSYAGAMGKPQFMPSSYRHFATDFSGNPKKDLMNDDKAVIASVANYFHKHGWHFNEGVAQPAKVKGLKYKQINTTCKTAMYNAKQLAQAGVKPLTASLHQPKKIGLIELTTAAGQEYWLTYPNFYVITRYNTSPQYALAVYLLSQQLKARWAANYSGRKFAYT